MKSATASTVALSSLPSIAAATSVLHAHGGAHLVECLLGDRIRALVALVQDVANRVHILGQLGAALAVRGQERVDRLGHILLERAGTGIADLLGDLLRVAACRQTGGGQQGGDLRTGKTARPAGYAIGGKTGTAETIDENTHKRSEDEYVVSFIGYAPADDPEIAIYVVVDRPNAKQQDDAKFATGIVRDILTEVLPYLNIFMTEELSEEEIAELNEKQLEITTQYTQTPEEDALEDAQDGESGEENPQDGTAEGENGEEPVWMSYPVDPETGYRVNPETGQKIDEETGEVIDPDESALGTDGPVNENLINPDSSQDTGEP